MNPLDIFRGVKVGYAAANEFVMMLRNIVIGGTVSVILLFWFFAYNGGEPWIIGTEFVFLIALTVVYWQIPTGIAGSFIEFWRSKDDPTKKSVWRLYLLVFVASMVAGHSAIVLRALHLEDYYLAVIVVLMLGVAVANLTSVSDLDWWLKRIVIFVVVVTAYGMIMTTYKHSQTPSEKQASSQRAEDQGRIDITKSVRLEYIDRIMTCKVEKGDVMVDPDAKEVVYKWTEEQRGGYAKHCSKKVPEKVRFITSETLKQYWPDEHAFWLEAQPGLMKGTGKLGAGEVAGGVVAGHLLWILLFGSAGLGGWWVLKKKDDGKDAKDGKAKSNAGIWIALAALGLGGSYYAFRDDPKVTAMVEQAKDSLPNMTNVRVHELPKGVHLDPMQSAVEVGDWVPTYIQHTVRVSMPQDFWHGKPAAFGSGSFIGNKVALRVTFDPTRPDLDLVFDGNCALISDHMVEQIPKACIGVWHDATNQNGGSFKLIWERLGRGYTIEMYTTATVPDLHDIRKWVINPGPQPVRKIEVRKK